jgi:NADH:ubiquinone oxidoreductase subunit F (NADH-binding)
MTPEDVIDEVMKSGLRGRGGAVSPLPKIWSFARASAGNPQVPSSATRMRWYPGAFMNRRVLEGDPHAVIEGMAIAAYAIGCNQDISTPG